MGATARHVARREKASHCASAASAAAAVTLAMLKYAMTPSEFCEQNVPLLSRVIAAAPLDLSSATESVTPICDVASPAYTLPAELHDAPEVASELKKAVAAPAASTETEQPGGRVALETVVLAAVWLTLI